MLSEHECFPSDGVCLIRERSRRWPGCCPSLGSMQSEAQQCRRYCGYRAAGVCAFVTDIAVIWLLVFTRKGEINFRSTEGFPKTIYLLILSILIVSYRYCLAISIIYCVNYFQIISAQDSFHWFGLILLWWENAIAECSCSLTRMSEILVTSTACLSVSFPNRSSVFRQIPHSSPSYSLFAVTDWRSSCLLVLAFGSMFLLKSTVFNCY